MWTAPSWQGQSSLRSADRCSQISASSRALDRKSLVSTHASNMRKSIIGPIPCASTGKRPAIIPHADGGAGWCRRRRYAVEDTPVVHGGNAAGLVREHRLYDAPFVVGEFVPHD